MDHKQKRALGLIPLMPHAMRRVIEGVQVGATVERTDELHPVVLLQLNGDGGHASLALDPDWAHSLGMALIQASFESEAEARFLKHAGKYAGADLEFMGRVLCEFRKAA